MTTGPTPPAPKSNKNLTPHSVKKQVVAGFVIFRKTEDGIKFLLLYRRGEYWNFPKGHFEEGETSMKTALRETEEETGLKASELRIIPGFKAYEKFHFFRGREKIQDTVILYLAETKQPRVVISPREHSGFAWFLLSDAQRVLRRYAQTRKVLKDAYDFIRGQSRKNRRPTTHAQPKKHPSAHQPAPLKDDGHKK